jgi:hypothetical protein
VKKLSKACKVLVEEGFAEHISGEAIRFTGNVDHNKLVEVEHSYATAIHKRWVDRTAKEREAEKKYHDFVVTY